MGTIKTTNIEPIATNGTVTLGSSGDTITIPSGATLDLSNATQTGVGGVNTPAFLAYKTSNQTISNITFTKVTFDAEQLDSDSKYDTSNSRFTPGVAGYYFIGAIWRFDTATNFPDGRFILYKNGSAAIQSAINNDDANGMTFSAIIYSDADDYFEMFTRQDSGGNVTINGGSTYLSDSTQAQFFGFRIIGV